MCLSASGKTPVSNDSLVMLAMIGLNSVRIVLIQCAGQGSVGAVVALIDAITSSMVFVDGGESLVSVDWERVVLGFVVWLR